MSFHFKFDHAMKNTLELKFFIKNSMVFSSRNGKKVDQLRDYQPVKLINQTVTFNGFFPFADFTDSLLMPKTECVSWKGEHKFFSFSFTQIGSEIAFEELNECGAIKTIIIQLAAMGAAISYR